MSCKRKSIPRIIRVGKNLSWVTQSITPIIVPKPTLTTGYLLVFFMVALHFSLAGCNNNVKTNIL